MIRFIYVFSKKISLYRTPSWQWISLIAPSTVVKLLKVHAGQTAFVNGLLN